LLSRFDELLDSSVCSNPAAFPTVQPTCKSFSTATMALADKTKEVVSQFDFSDADLNSHVNEFLSQMCKHLPRHMLLEVS
jgi:hypothetical protein